MGQKEKLIVSNSGPLIHLAQIDKLCLLKAIFEKVIIPLEVKIEIIDRGKEEGAPDAFLLEEEMESGFILLGTSGAADKVMEIAENAGIDEGEAAAIFLAKEKNCPVLLDDLAARRFAAGLGLEVTGSIGLLLRCAFLKMISRKEALDILDKLARVMWLSIGVYEDAKEVIEGMD